MTLPAAQRRAVNDIGLMVLLFVACVLGAGLVGRSLPAGIALPATVLLQGGAILLGLRMLLARRAQGWRDVALLRPRPRDPGLGLLALIAVLVLNAAVTSLLFALAPALFEAHVEQMRTLGAGLTADRPWPAVAALMLFVGFYEEVLARGFLLSRCRTLFDDGSTAVLVSALVFGIAHFYQGPIGMVQTTLVGVVFAALALRWGTLWPLILAHAALNLSSLMVIERLEGLP